jgi:uncharacterized membrane protein
MADTNRNGKKIAAPVIITMGVIAYYAITGVFLIKTGLPVIFKIIALIVSSVITLLIIVVLIERVKEIKSGEEDDLSKY